MLKERVVSRWCLVFDQGRGEMMMMMMMPFFGYLML